MTVDLIMLCHNQLSYTKRAVESIIENTYQPVNRFWIVNNASTDDTKLYLSGLAENYSNVKVVNNRKNKGFVVANNEIMKRSKADVVVLLNNDIEVEPYWLHEMIVPFKKRKKVGITGPMTNISGEVMQMCEKDETESGIYCRASIAVPFFCSAISKKLIDDIGYLDTIFGMGYGDDGDYCIRTVKAGWDIIVCKGAYVYHYKMKTFKSIMSDDNINKTKRDAIELLKERYPDRYKKDISIAGITIVRNEQLIIRDTLDHFGQFCNGGIYVYDDASEDNTREICDNHPAVRQTIGRKEWTPDRYKRQGSLRQAVWDLAKQDADWILVFDADERIDFDFQNLVGYDAVCMKLFDFYITQDDIYKQWNEREWCGPEYREIPVLFRNNPDVSFKNKVRIPLFTGRVLFSGYIKHYSKALSVERWERDCDFYSGYDFPDRFKKKWSKRKGKAIHTKSDFGNDLMKWEDKEIRGFKLED